MGEITRHRGAFDTVPLLVRSYLYSVSSCARKHGLSPLCYRSAGYDFFVTRRSFVSRLDAHAIFWQGETGKPLTQTLHISPWSYAQMNGIASAGTHEERKERERESGGWWGGWRERGMEAGRQGGRVMHEHTRPR